MTSENQTNEPGRQAYEKTGGLHWDDLEPWAKDYWAEVARIWEQQRAAPLSQRTP
jgi:hypothetical protein